MAAVESSANRHDVDEKEAKKKRKKKEQESEKKKPEKIPEKIPEKMPEKGERKNAKKAKIARKCHQIQHYFFLFPVKVIMCHSSQA